VGDAGVVLPQLRHPIKWGAVNLYTIVHKNFGKIRLAMSQAGVDSGQGALLTAL
jgi:hypothetical protein